MTGGISFKPFNTVIPVEKVDNNQNKKLKSLIIKQNKKYEHVRFK